MCAHRRNFITLAILLFFGFFTTSSIAATERTGVYDEAVYTSNVENSLKKLDAFYLQYVDKSLTGGERERAKRSYIVLARKLLGDMNKKMDRLNPKLGDALSHTDVLLINHIQVMLLDVLAGEQQSNWLAGDRVE